MRFAQARKRSHTVLGSAFLLALTSAAVVLDAQSRAAKPASAPGDRPDATSQIQVQSNLVTAPVTVTDRSGQIVYGLRESDFRIYDNGVLQEITRFDEEEHPVAAVILVQNNDAVAPLVRHLDFLVPVITQMLLGAKGRAAVLLFDGQIQRAQNFTNSSALLEKTLKDIRAGGGKARLNDALMQAINMLDHQPKVDRRIIVAISDGADSGSETTRREVIVRATAAQVTIYGLGLSGLKALLKRKPEPPPPNPIDTNVARPTIPGMPNTPDMNTRIWETPVPGGPILGEIQRSAVAHSKIFKSDLAFFTRFTGGTLYAQWSSGALVQHLARLANQLHTQYEIAYVPNNLSQTGFHRIDIRVERPNVQVRGPEGYFYYKGGSR